MQLQILMGMKSSRISRCGMGAQLQILRGLEVGLLYLRIPEGLEARAGLFSILMLHYIR
jgi:hypothetical protein